METTTTSKSIILFDGVCNLCNGFVQFVIKRDVDDRFVFASLQSPEAKALLAGSDEYPLEIKTIVLIEDKKMYKQSGAVLRIFRNLRGGWGLLYGLVVIPAFLRNMVYNLIAHHRYHWFGRRRECMIPSAGIKRKFLDNERK